MGRAGSSVPRLVACEGLCAAVGTYLDSNGYQEALLDVLSGGTWTSSEGSLPEPPGTPNMFGVSCSDSSTCMAVGTEGPTDSALVYQLSGGTWQSQPQPPLPSDYQNNLVLQSVSCPDTSDCFVAASYGTIVSGSETSHGLILTYSGGNWSDEEAPLPSNADPNPPWAGHVLYSIDCADVNDCVAGGGYGDTSGNIDPLLLSFRRTPEMPGQPEQPGTWTAEEAPLPSVGQAQSALVTGMSCPSVGACIADGYYFVNSSLEEGMFLTQSSGGWTAVSSGVPATPFARRESALPRVSSKTALYGMSCTKTTFCNAVGKHGKRPLIEKLTRR